MSLLDCKLDEQAWFAQYPKFKKSGQQWIFPSGDPPPIDVKLYLSIISVDHPAASRLDPFTNLLELQKQVLNVYVSFFLQFL